VSTDPLSRLTYLLIQIRNPGDPIREQEVDCFARALQCEPRRIRPINLIAEAPSARELDAVDAVLIGGSGEYSVTVEGDWLDRGLDAMRELYATSKPTFASCWGFQAMARALDGEVVHDLDRAELGTYPLTLTDTGRVDPIFSELGTPFDALVGHQDVVTRLPEEAELLASSERVAHQAFRMRNAPIYATQFHPELDLDTFLERVWAYPEYVERITGQDLETFAAECRPAPASRTLLTRFVRHVFGT
jgi:GMP synthase (glutamine-hydrolysing)